MERKREVGILMGDGDFKGREVGIIIGRGVGIILLKTEIKGGEFNTRGTLFLLRVGHIGYWGTSNSNHVNMSLYRR